jgi:hypothetical protein
MPSLATLVLKCQWSNDSFYHTRDLRKAGASGEIKTSGHFCIAIKCQIP